ncbi:hypothetical protein HS125_15640 [bacterium]|nr:hypothetical protein [bacterium]
MSGMEGLVVIIAMLLVFKVLQMRYAYAERNRRERQAGGGPAWEGRLARLEERLATLEALLVEQEKRRSEEEKWKALER